MSFTIAIVYSSSSSILFSLRCATATMLCESTANLALNSFIFCCAVTRDLLPAIACRKGVTYEGAEGVDDGSKTEAEMGAD